MDNTSNYQLARFTYTLVALAVSVHLLVFASSVLIPILFGFYLSVLIYTPMELLRKLYIPKAISALIPILLLFAVVASAAVFLYTPILNKVETIPDTVAKLQTQIQPIKEAIDEVNVKTSKVEAIVNDALKNDSKEPKAVVIEEEKQRWDEILFEELGSLAWYFSVTLLLCYFFLVGGDALARNIAITFQQRKKRVIVLSLARKIRASLAHFIAITLCVNLSYGLSVALVLAFFQVEYALLWGLAIGLSRYIPYGGNIISLLAVALAVAEQSFNITAIAIASSITAGLMFVTGNFIDPVVHSRQFHLNPIFIFISIIFWSWLWGIAGLFIAIPTLLFIAIICSEVPGLHRIYIILCLNNTKAH